MTNSIQNDKEKPPLGTIFLFGDQTVSFDQRCISLTDTQSVPLTFVQLWPGGLFLVK